MKIVIDISEEDYADCLHYVVDKDNCYPYSDFNLREIIRNGQVLPEDHGDLIDRDELITQMPSPVEDEYKTAYRIINNIPAVIESNRGDY